VNFAEEAQTTATDANKTATDANKTATNALSTANSKMSANSSSGTYKWSFEPTSGISMSKGATTVLSIDSTGLFVSGKILASSGTIGKWNINSLTGALEGNSGGYQLELYPTGLPITIGNHYSTYFLVFREAGSGDKPVAGLCPEGFYS
jgi:hypothetical protein